MNNTYSFTNWVLLFSLVIIWGQVLLQLRSQLLIYSRIACSLAYFNRHNFNDRFCPTEQHSRTIRARGMGSCVRACLPKMGAGFGIKNIQKQRDKALKRL